MNRRARWVGAMLTGFGVADGATAGPPAPTPPPVVVAGEVAEVLPPVRLTLPAFEAVGPPTMVAPMPAPEILWESPLGLDPLRPEAFYVELDYLRWWLPGQAQQPLVTAGNVGDFVPGGIGQPGTQVLAGGTTAGDLWVNGLRGRVGGAFEEGVGWELGAFVISPVDDRAFFSSNSFPVLARPFFDTLAGAESVLLDGLPDAFDGSVAVRTRTSFWGGEGNLTFALGETGAATAFVGYRYLRLTDELLVNERFRVGPAGFAFVNGVNLFPGAEATVVDQFRTRNEFQGGQVGMRYRATAGRLGLDLRASVAVGASSQEVQVNGRTDSVDADGTIRSGGAGLLAVPSNTGRHTRDVLAVIPEAGVKAYYQLGRMLSVHAGYDVLYWPMVLRAGDQVDRAVDSRQSPGSPNFNGARFGDRPGVYRQETEFWAQGFNVGLRLDY